MGGDPDATFVFQTDAAFNTAASSQVILANGAQAANVYWVVAGAAGTGASTTLSGTILAVGAITLGAGTTLIGRALSRDAVTLAGSTIRFTAALPPTITIDGGSTATTTKDTTPTITGTSNAAALSPVTCAHCRTDPAHDHRRRRRHVERHGSGARRRHLPAFRQSP